MQVHEAKDRKIKCLVWDLDNTLWQGILLEDDPVEVDPRVPEIVRALDARGILQSVASKNDEALAMAKLEELGLAEFFLYPQIGWGTKSASIEGIRECLGLGIEAMAFIDDQPFELEEVAFAHPEVLCVDAAELDGLLKRPEFEPLFVTDDARRRRELYRLDQRRREAEERFEGPRDDFLATLGMVFTITLASEEDLKRAEELTVRTHQLNTTGQAYDFDELAAFRRSKDHLLVMADLEDRFGPYGKIGLALLERDAGAWLIKLFLMSCRVVGRGVGTIMLHEIMGVARDEGLAVRAHFRPSGRNEMMLMTYRFAGFREIAREGDLQVLEKWPQTIPTPPPWVTVHSSIRERGKA